MQESGAASQVIDAIRMCDNALNLREDPALVEGNSTLRENLERLESAHSYSWLGYQANVYYSGFQPPPPGEHFSSEWGFQPAIMNPTSSNWQEYSREDVERAALEGIDPGFRGAFKTASDRATAAFEEANSLLLTVCGVLLERNPSPTLERIRNEIESNGGGSSEYALTRAWGPQGRVGSRDSLAISQGIRVPPHKTLAAEQASRLSRFLALEALAKSGREVIRFMEINEMVKGEAASMAVRVFIGHGQAPVWRELKDFIQDRLQLPWEEFNRESAAGIPTAVRLQELLDSSSFALLIMTAEDEHSDKSLHARENVLHEAGLFQGRLGFAKAIVLLEDGCEEFSNIHGLGQIRFPVDDIAACFEEVRRVLEREGALPASA